MVWMSLSGGRALGSDDAFEAFDAFAAKTFTAAAEPLAYQLPGEKLRFVDSGTWAYAGEDSATVAFETNLPCSLKLDFAQQSGIQIAPQPSERPEYIHVIRLTGLKAGKPLQYKATATDARGSTATLAGKPIVARKIAAAIYVDANTPTPVKCDQAGAIYVLKSDLVAKGTGFSVVAPGVTIDLNGHTLTYNDAATASDAGGSDFGQLAAQGTQGVRCSYGTRGSTRLYNGTIKQGAGNGGYGSVPVLFRGDEIAGVTLDYYGTQVSGIENEAKDVHHNVFVDRGTELTNRHQGVQCVNVSGNVHHNLILRARQRGITAASGAKITNNEIYVDSCATNSFGVMMYKSRGCEVADNRIFGTGYLAIGVGTVSEGVGDIKVLRNFIQMQATAPVDRWNEYGDQSGAYCVRVTWGGENIEYADNVLVSRGRDGGMVRGVWFCPNPKQNNVAFRHNTIKAIAENPASTKWGAVVVCGEDSADAKPGLFEKNTIISNFCNVRLGEEYGTGKNARFVDNTFVRDGDAAGYATVVCGFWTYNNNGSVFLNSKCEGGADLGKVRWEGTGDNSFAVGKTDGRQDVIEKKYAANTGG